MSETYYWAAIDAKSGRCTYSVIGTERRDDPADELGLKWSPGDAIAGRCLASEVGGSRNPPAELLPDQLPTEPEADIPAPADSEDDDPPAPVEPFRPLTKAERKQLALELMDKILIKAHGDPGAFMEDGSSQLNKFLEFANKADAEDNSANTLDVTVQAFSRLQPAEQDRALLDVLVRFVPADRRQDALERLGMSEADYDALHAAAGRPRV